MKWSLYWLYKHRPKWRPSNDIRQETNKSTLWERWDPKCSPAAKQVKHKARYLLAQLYHVQNADIREAKAQGGGGIRVRPPNSYFSAYH